MPSWGGSTAGPPRGKTVGASHGVRPRVPPRGLLPTPRTDAGTARAALFLEKNPKDKPDGDGQACGRPETGEAWRPALPSIQTTTGMTETQSWVTRDCGGRRLFVRLKTRRTAGDAVGNGTPTWTAPRGGTRRSRTPRPKAAPSRHRGRPRGLRST